VKLLLEKGVELESKNYEGRTPLSMAAAFGREAVVKLLVEKGAELESRDSKYGQTPLSWAAERGHEAVVKLLVENGAELESLAIKNAQNSSSRREVPSGARTFLAGFGLQNTSATMRGLT
jgi:ankyrin repeat protein